MAVFGRRQPHAPVILRGGRYQPPVGKLIIPRGVSCSILAARRPSGGAIVVKGGGQPAVARFKIVRTIGADSYPRRPRGKVIILQGAPPSPATAFVAGRPVVISQARAAVSPRLLPRSRVIVRTGGGAPPVGRVIVRQALQPALFPRLPRGDVIILGRGPSPPIGRVVVRQALQSALLPRLPRGDVITLGRGPRPPVGRSRILGQSLGAALFARRPAGRVYILRGATPQQSPAVGRIQLQQARWGPYPPSRPVTIQTIATPPPVVPVIIPTITGFNDSTIAFNGAIPFNGVPTLAGKPLVQQALDAALRGRLSRGRVITLSRVAFKYQPPIGRIRVVSQAQTAALYPRLPRGKVLILRNGSPPPVGRFRFVSAVTAAIFPRLPRGGRQVLKGGPRGPTGRQVFVRAPSTRPQQFPPILRTFVRPPVVLPPPVGKTLIFQALDATLRARAPKGRVSIVRGGGRPPVGRTRVLQALDAALRARTPKGRVSIIRGGGRPPVGRTLVRQALAASLARRSPQGLIKISRAGGPPPVIVSYGVGLMMLL